MKQPKDLFKELFSDTIRSEEFNREYCADTADIVADSYAKRGMKREAFGARQVAMRIRRDIRRMREWRKSKEYKKLLRH
jgi:hypothetical protein